jgi:hypothetical protein
VHLLCVDIYLCTISERMPHISIDLRQLQTIMRRSLYISRTLLVYSFRPPFLQFLEPSTSDTSKNTAVRFNQQLHIALLFLDLLERKGGFRRLKDLTPANTVRLSLLLSGEPA